MVLDKQDLLYVANEAQNSITVYTKKGADLLLTVTDGVKQPRALTVDSHGTLYVANKTNVTVYTGTTLEQTLTLKVKASALTVDSADNLYARVTVKGQPEVQVYKHGSKMPKTRIVDGVGLGNSLTVDNKGTVYVGNHASGKG